MKKFEVKNMEEAMEYFCDVVSKVATKKYGFKDFLGTTDYLLAVTFLDKKNQIVQAYEEYVNQKDLCKAVGFYSQFILGSKGNFEAFNNLRKIRGHLISFEGKKWKYNQNAHKVWEAIGISQETFRSIIDEVNLVVKETCEASRREKNDGILYFAGEMMKFFKKDRAIGLMQLMECSSATAAQDTPLKIFVQILEELQEDFGG